VGHSSEGAALCFNAFCQRAMSIMGDHQHPDVTLDCISFARCLPAYEREDYPAIREVMWISLDRLARAGADFFVCPDNTVHRALEADGPPFPLPGLHIAEVVAGQAAALGAKRVGILGTAYTMDSPLYPRVLAERGIDAGLPSEADRRTVDRIIFGELVRRVLRGESRQAYVDIIGRLAAAGCDMVALVCTEIPMLITPDDSPLPTLDSTRLLAHAAVDVATGARPMPDWRGGRPAGLGGRHGSAV
jgi:aspartate racemase